MRLQSSDDFWPCRRMLKGCFGRTLETWLAWHEYTSATQLSSFSSIAFAFVATHNHFVLDRGGKVFKQSAPVIKLPESATEDDHLALLGVLNSSTACFWLKQVSQSKGTSGIGRRHPRRGMGGLDTSSPAPSWRVPASYDTAAGVRS